MSEPPDPILVARCADLARTCATALRVRAARLGATAEASEWAGPAARAFRADTRELVLRLHGAARHLDDAAEQLERHATTLRTEEAAAARRRADELHTIRAGLHAIGVPT